MRAGGCAVQQALTPEAAGVVRQAVNLARRRGHAQVTPLHVANTMLSSPTGLLRAACLQSHSHPLQCKALELCFNVALNRLPASTAPSPMLGNFGHHHHQTPSLSNALVAAFKRAQAHQRRGSIESQQQPLLAVKIELEQLIISILDDPSVSRVMREAGFSSTQVKSNVEQAVSSSSLEMCASATPSSSPRKSKEAAISSSFVAAPQVSKARPSGGTAGPGQAKAEDVACVVEALACGRKRSIVIVGECLVTSGGVVRGVMDRVDKGDVPEALRNAQFISLPLLSFRDMPREEVDQKVGELRCLVKGCGVGGRGAVLYLGDLKWPAEYRASSFFGEKAAGRSYYCPIEHVIMEIRSMVFGGEMCTSYGNGRFWVLGIATYQAFMRCKVGHPSLAALWDLQPLTTPSGSLKLTLNFDSSDSQSDPSNDKTIKGDVQFWSAREDGVIRSQLTCCEDCSINFESEARSLPNMSHGSRSSAASTLPSWLQQYKQEIRRRTNADEGCIQLKDLCRKWNAICNSAHKSHRHTSEITFNFSSASPSSSSISSYDQRYPSLHQSHHPWLIPLGREQQLWMPERADEDHEHNNSSSQARDQLLEGKTTTLAFTCCNPASNPTSASTSSGTMEVEHPSKFKELNAENLKTLCAALEKRVSWQQDIIPEIASTVLKCRSGMVRRKDKSNSAAESKEETWLFFQGGDNNGKERIARELASAVFGSSSKFVSIGLSDFSSTRSDSTDDSTRNKRTRSDTTGTYLERLFEVMSENPRRVVLIQDIEQVDSRTQAAIKSAIERGKIRSRGGEEVGVGDAIIILSCESFDCRSRACSPSVKHKAAGSEDQKEEGGVYHEEESGTNCLSLDLNLSAEEDQDLDDDDGAAAAAAAGSCHNVGLLDLVDRAFFFKIPSSDL